MKILQLELQTLCFLWALTFFFKNLGTDQWDRTLQWNQPELLQHCMSKAVDHVTEATDVHFVHFTRSTNRFWRQVIASPASSVSVNARVCASVTYLKYFTPLGSRPWNEEKTILWKERPSFLEPAELAELVKSDRRNWNWHLQKHNFAPSRLVANLS